MNFEHIKCDGCGREFEKDDDIVVCPVCGTPQHRSCFEHCGGCVNASKHELGFEWEKKTEETKTSERFGETFKVGEEPDTMNKQSRIFGNMDPGIGFDIEPGGELPELDRLVESRVKILAPGITPEQRKEQLCGSEIGEVVSFIGSNTATYVKKFRKREHLNKKSFNWGAFFFTPIWFFYRKMYKIGVIYLSLFVSITMLMAEPAANFLAIYDGIVQSGAQTITEAQVAAVSEAMVPILIFEAVMLIIRLVAGLSADKVYWNYCRKSLQKIEELKKEDDVSALSYYLSHCSTSFLGALIAMIAYSFLPQILLSLF